MVINYGRERYDRELKDILDGQDEIAKAIAERLRVTLANGKGESAGRTGDDKCRGLSALFEGPRAGRSPRSQRPGRARPASGTAAKLDPGYSLVWAGIADALTVMAYSGAARGSESKSQAMAAAKRSIELDPSSAAGHTALACATLLFQNNRTMAKQAFERALDLSPSYGIGGCWYANFYLNWACGESERPREWGNPPRARQRSAVGLRHDESRSLPVYCRSAA